MHEHHDDEFGAGVKIHTGRGGKTNIQQLNNSGLTDIPTYVSQ